MAVLSWRPWAAPMAEPSPRRSRTGTGETCSAVDLLRIWARFSVVVVRWQAVRVKARANASRERRIRVMGRSARWDGCGVVGRRWRAGGGRAGENASGERRFGVMVRPEEWVRSG